VLFSRVRGGTGSRSSAQGAEVFVSCRRKDGSIRVSASDDFVQTLDDAFDFLGGDISDLLGNTFH
jgi:hypothetical protein